MECACEIDIDISDGDTLKCRSEKIQTAQKQHRCHECADYISPGEKYEYVKYLCAGKWECHKTCSDCLALRTKFFSGCYYYGGIRDEIAEYINEADGNIPEDCIAGLPSGAAAFVCEKIEHAWENYLDRYPDED